MKLIPPKLLLLALLAIICLLPSVLWAQPYSPLVPVPPQTRVGCSSWADYDGDGDPDLLYAGLDSSGGLRTRLYALNGAMLTEDLSQSFPPLLNAASAWADFDGDGDLDLALAGDSARMHPLLCIFRNNAGTLTRLALGLPGLSHPDLKWADLDQDGDLDLVAAGWNPARFSHGLWIRNLGGGQFSASGVPELEGLDLPRLAVGDLDGDGRVDVALSGSRRQSGPVLHVLRNLGGWNFDDLPIQVPGTADGSLAFGAHNLNAGLELLVSGHAPAPSLAIGTLAFGQVQPVPHNLPALSNGDAVWLDFDQDGDRDVVLAGRIDGVPQTRIYRREPTGFVLHQPAAGLPALYQVRLQVLDWDVDGHADIYLSGLGPGDIPTHRLLTFNPTTQNYQP